MHVARMAAVVGAFAFTLACSSEGGRELGVDSASESSDTGTDESSTGGDGDDDPTQGDGDGDEDEGDCGNGVLDGDELCDDGVNDGSYEGCDPGCKSLGPFCGDDKIEFGPELCDDGNDEAHDGCLPNCQVPRSCREILQAYPDALDGIYLLGPKGPDFMFATTCDMTTDGGGWTAIPRLQLCSGNLDTTLTAVESAPTSGVDGNCRPYTRDSGGGHTYHFDLVFPAGFEAFYLSDFVARANAGSGQASEIHPELFSQTSWDIAYSEANAVGDIGYGSGDAAGPAVTFGELLEGNLACQSCEAPFPGGAAIYEIGISTLFRMGWGDSGAEAEGWYPWWSGTLYLR